MRRKTDRFAVTCAVVSFLCMLVSGVVSGTVIQTKATADKNTATVQQIQDERTSNILRSCRDTNKHHDDTIKAIDRVTLSRLTNRPVPRTTSPTVVKAELESLKAEMSTSERKQLEQSKASTNVIIGTLAPRRDCEALVAIQAPSAASPTPTK